MTNNMLNWPSAQGACILDEHVREAAPTARTKMQNLQAWVSILIACASAGAFIDFVIGKKGQKRAREILETWWIRLDDVKVRTFGSEESLVAAAILRWCFGPFFSVRRLCSLFIILLVCSTAWLAQIDPEFKLHPIGMGSIYAGLIRLALVSVSISATIWLCEEAPRIIGANVKTNLVIYIATILLAFVGLGFFATALHLLIGSLEVALVGGSFWKTFFDYLSRPSVFLLRPSSYRAALTIAWAGFGGLLAYLGVCLTLIPGTLRLLLALSFFLSVLLRPLNAGLLAVTARIVESDKPIFTLVLGGLGAILKTVQDLASKL